MALRLSGLASGMDTDSIVQELMKAQRLKSTKLQNKITTLEWSQERWSSLNTKLYAFYTGPLSKIKMQGSFNTKTATSSDAGKVEVKASTTVPEGNHSIQVKAVASAQFITGARLNQTVDGKAIGTDTKLTDLGFKVSDSSTIVVKTGDKEVQLEVDSDTTVNDFLSAAQSVGLNASYDTTQKRFFISSKESGFQNAFSISLRSGSVEPTNSLSLLGLSEITTTTNPDNSISVSVGSGVSLVQPSDAVVIYNGAEIRSTTNTITVNGLTLTVKEATEENETVNVAVTRDTQAVYDMVKDFVKTYNEILKEMNTAYYADLAKGYDPLTDEQKEAMTDDQIKQWEDKIKASLLRRDSTLNSIMATITGAMTKRVAVDGKNYALSSFGIAAIDYTEKGLLHIDGDTEDTLTGVNEDKLMAAINDDPDAVMEVFNSLASDLYSSMTEQMKSSNLKSALTFYNDKEMKQTLSDYETNLSDLETKLSDMEERYYDQFTAMEMALSKLNSQSASLASMLGTNTQG